MPANASMNTPAPKLIPGTILQHIQDATLLTDRKNKIIHANPQFLALTGYCPKEIIGKTDRLLRIENTKRKMLSDEKQKQHGNPEIMITTKNGHQIPVTVSTIQLPEKSVFRIFAKIGNESDGESRYRQIVESMNTAVWCFDSDNRTRYVNAKCCEMTGYSPQEMEGRIPHDFFEHENVKEMKVALEVDRPAGRKKTKEATLINRQGKHVPVLLTGTPLPDGKIIGTMHDLTEVKRRESLHNILIENMQEAVYMTNAAAQPIYGNPAFFQLTGYTWDELLRLQERDLWNKETARHIAHLLSTDRKQGISSNYEGTLVTKDDKQIPVSIRGTPLPNGGTIGIIADLRAIRKEELQFRHLVEHMNEIVWILDESHKTVYVNPRFTALTGYTLQEVRGRPPYEFYDAEGWKRVRWALEHERPKGIASDLEATLITKSGKPLSVLISGSSHPSGGFIGVITDITELRKKERSEHMLSSAVTHANDAMIIVGPTKRIESWNKGAKIMFGYRAEEMIGQTLERIFSRVEATELVRSKNAHLKIELRGKHKNKHAVPVSITSTIVRMDNDPKHSIRLLVIRDISLRLKYDEELTSKYLKLREAYNEFGTVRRQMDYMFELTDLCIASTSLKSLGDFIVNAIIMLAKVDACALRIYRPEIDSLELISSFGLHEEWKGKKIVPLSASLMKRAYDRRCPLKSIDLMSESAYHSKHLARKSNFASALVIPLLKGSTIVGGLTLYVGPNKKLEVFENEFIERFAKLVSLALTTVLG